MSTALNILYVTAEMDPYAKTSGPADVAAALPKSLRLLGHDVRVLMPRYHPTIDPETHNLRVVLPEVRVPHGASEERVAIWQGLAPSSIPVYFADHKLFGTEPPYGFPQDKEGVILFARTALEVLRLLNWRPDVIHCHDWYAGLIPNWLRTLYADDPLYERLASVYTFHNLAYQGIYSKEALEIAGLSAYGHFADIGEVSGAEPETVNFAGRGILFADRITTVSMTYAREVLQPRFGRGLSQVLQFRAERLSGIVNGIDTDAYNPARDPYLCAPYTSDRLERRGRNKRRFQEEYGLAADSDRPLVAFIGRLRADKGAKLIRDTFDQLMALGAQFVLLGEGEHDLQEAFRALVARYPGQATTFIRFDNRLARIIYASADILLEPSELEPCGLPPLIGLHYGCIPVASRVGGHVDNLVAYDPATGAGDSFLFDEQSPEAFLQAMTRAVTLYKTDRAKWQALMRTGMARDFSWRLPARSYEALYQDAAQAHQAELASRKLHDGLTSWAKGELRAPDSLAPKTLHESTERERRLRKQVDQEEKVLSAVREIDRELNSRTEVAKLQEVLDIILRKAIDLTRADCGFICRLEPVNGDGELVLERESGCKSSAEQARRKLGGDIASQVARTGQSFRGPDKDARFPDRYSGMRSELCVPLKLGEQTVGILDVQSASLDEFDSVDLAALENLAHQVVAAIIRARQVERQQAKQRESQAITEVADRFRSVMEFGRFWEELKGTLTAIARIIDASCGLVLVRDLGRPGQFVVRSVTGLTNDQLERAYLVEASQLLSDIAQARDARVWRCRQGAEADKLCADVSAAQPGVAVDSALAVPLFLGRDTVGALLFFGARTTETANSLGFEDESIILKAVAPYIVTAYQNCIAYEKERHLVKEKEQFLEDVSHQIIAPLNGLLGYTEGLQANFLGWDDNRRRHYLKTIISMSRWTARLARNFSLDVSDSELRLNKRSTKLTRLLINCAIDVQGFAATKDMDVTVDERAVDALPDVSIDRWHFSQAIMNLLDNAVKYGDKHTKVWIAGCVVDDSIELTVTNLGIELKEEDAELIFGRSYRTQAARDAVPVGTGIGLSVARKIVVKHDGKLSARPSVPVRDETTHKEVFKTTFIIRLPLPGSLRRS